jgi:hypothetical protein
MVSQHYPVPPDLARRLEQRLCAAMTRETQ